MCVCVYVCAFLFIYLVYPSVYLCLILLSISALMLVDESSESPEYPEEYEEHEPSPDIFLQFSLKSFSVFLLHELLELFSRYLLLLCCLLLFRIEGQKI